MQIKKWWENRSYWKKGVIIGLFLLIFLISGCAKQDKFEEWKLNIKTNGIYPVNFEHPYIKCIFDKTCNGSVYLYINYNPNNLSNEEIKKTLNEYGKSDPNYEDYIVIKDIGNLSKLINLNFVNLTYTYIARIESDYKINDSEIRKCNIDSDCGYGKWWCNSVPINKNYTDFWNAYEQLIFLDTTGDCGFRTGFEAFDIYNDLKCINHNCQAVLNVTNLCNSQERYYSCVKKEYYDEEFCNNLTITCKVIPTNSSWLEK